MEPVHADYQAIFEMKIGYLKGKCGDGVHLALKTQVYPHYVVIARTKEIISKKLEKSVDFSVGICYYNTRLERQGKTY